MSERSSASESRGRPTSFLRALGRLFVAALWILAAALLLWHLLRYLVGDAWLPIRLGNYLAPWLCLLTLGALALAALIRRRWLVVALALLVLLFALHYMPFFLPRRAPPAGPEADRLRVMTFNVHLSNRNGAQIAALIRAYDPDLIALQEAHPTLQAELGAALDPDYAYTVVSNTDDLPLVLISHYPLTTLITPAQAWRSQRALLELPQHRVIVWNLHPVSPLSRQNWEMHDRTSQAMVEAIARESMPTIVVGDLNTTDWTAFHRNLTDLGLTDLHQAVGWGFGFTFPDARRLDAPWNRLPPLLRVDYVLVSDTFRPQRVWVGPADLGSDHLPLFGDLVVAPPSEAP